MDKSLEKFLAGFWVYFLELWYLGFPAECLLCRNERDESSSLFCSEHERSWKAIGKSFYFCKKCGDEKCPQWFCFKDHLNPVPWKSLKAGGLYDEFLQKLIQRFKTQTLTSQEELGLFEKLWGLGLGQIQAQGSQKERVLVAIPSSRRRRSLSLSQRWALFLSRKLDLAAFSLVWQPSKNPRKQAFRSSEERFEGHFEKGWSCWICLSPGCFACSLKRWLGPWLAGLWDCHRVKKLKTHMSLGGSSLLEFYLVDDVMTTGETARGFIKGIETHLEPRRSDMGPCPYVAVFFCLAIRQRRGASRPF